MSCIKGTYFEELIDRAFSEFAVILGCAPQSRNYQATAKLPESAWRNWGESVKGPLHDKLGLPNQDSWLAASYEWGDVLAVSDGLGSKSHSDIGSRAACQSVIESADRFVTAALSDIKQLLLMIHAQWLKKIQPRSPDECSATCLFAIRMGGDFVLGRLGDGLIVFCTDDEAGDFCLDDLEEDSFSNTTECMERDFYYDKWQIINRSSNDCMGVVLCTDGIADDLIPQQRIPFARGLCFNNSERNLNDEERQEQTKEWMNDWPVDGHSDDKTIACLYKEDIFV